MKNFPSYGNFHIYQGEDIMITFEEVVDLQSSSVQVGNNYSRKHDQTSSGPYHQLLPGDHWCTGGREKKRERERERS